MRMYDPSRTKGRQHMNAKRISLVAVLALSMAGAGLIGGDALAQSYPSKPITFIVPVGPGSGSDVIARILAQKVNETWSSPITVENRPGASASIGMEAAAKAPPDGYTIVIAGTSQLINPLVSNMRYDIVKDFAPVSLSGTLPYVLAVPNELPAKSLKELVALAKSRPGKLNYAAQIGGVPHFMGEALKSAQGIDVVMVPYSSTTDAQADVMSGRVEIWFTTMATALPLVKSGRVRALGVAGDTRSASMPDVPTMAEAGFPELDVSVGLFILAPVGTPKPIIAALNTQFVKAIGTKEVADRLAAAGFEPKGSTPEELGALLRSEVARWSKIAKESNIRVQ
jgi:tripartite-type tricarboxylate transporter receptor subunit TctC